MDITLCLTHDCTLRCAYCYGGGKFRRAMSRETALRAIDFAFAEVMRGSALRKRQERLVLGFFGGEPLLEWDLLRQCTDYAQAVAAQTGTPLSLTLTTNMTLLDRERAEWLKSQGFHMGLSLDGSREMHDACRKTAGGSGSHDLCIEALGYFTDYWYKAEVITVVTPANARFLAGSLSDLYGRGVRRLCLNLDYGAPWSPADFERLEAGADEAARIFVESFRADDPFPIANLSAKIHAQVEGGYKESDKCRFGEGELAVSAAGHFYPCARLVGQDDQESLRIGHVSIGYDRARQLALISRRGNRNPECPACPLNNRCINWCGCVNYVSSKESPDQASSFVCRTERLFARQADRAAELLWGERNTSFLRYFYE